ncbi:THAP domain-containing protein 2-like [Metopolophium dirhodum]|uniref:THAP domain-containing protein 2-like n=1 Tax=Metopolophium dirhodum TaxID=44670 RepID=UPI00298F8E39|nr:THAP domain-containing protein 2-like [Metopolophium dirhodum]
MPVSCAACTNRYKVGQNIHFFRFPISKNELMTKWLSAMRRKQFVASQWSRLCSVHFTEQDFQVRPGAHRLLLKDNAVPSIFPSFPPYLQKQNKIPRKTPTLRNTCSKDVTVDQCDDMHSISNFKSVEIQTETSHSNEEMHKNKIKILQQKLRRKNKKIENLEDLVKNLKNIGHSKLPNKKQDTQSLHLDDVQIAFEETNDNCKSDNTNLNVGGICQDLSNCNDFEATIKQFDKCVGKMKRAFDSDKAYFLPTIKSFVKSMENNVKTHAGLCSAMENFGKYSELNPKLNNSKLIDKKRIGTQPTERTRQKTQIGRRNNLTAGRTPNWRRVPEHGYAIRISSSRSPQKKRKTPHSLTRCIEINKVLDSTYNLK